MMRKTEDSIVGVINAPREPIVFNVVSRNPTAASGLIFNKSAVTKANRDREIKGN